MTIYSALVAIYTCLCFHAFLAIASGPYCLKFTWPGAKNIDVDECTANIPCVEPIYYGSKLDVTKIWNDNVTNDGTKDPKDSDFVCRLEPDNVCIRYAYIYNNVAVNVSHFCGKVIQDQTTPVVSGCYAQHIEGYTIQVCACRSRNNSEIPCNATVGHARSTLIAIVAAAVPLFLYIFGIS